MSDENAIATAYLQVRYGQFGSPYGRKQARVVKCTQNNPEQLEPGCIKVKVRLRFPVAAFGPFEPSAVIDIPAELIQHAIEVEAVDPS